MYQKQLTNIGLTKTQSNILDYLLENGSNKARDIAQAIKQPRGAVYNSLEELLALELVEKIEKDKQVAKFQACHPGKLESILQKKEVELKQNKKVFEEILPNLVSNYNLTLNKPGVKFYEGEEGLRKVLYDTLSSRTDIYLFLNGKALSEDAKFNEINEEYMKKRVRAGIRKKILEIGKAPDSYWDEVQGDYEKITETKYIDKEVPAFRSSMQIYDGKVAYQMIDNGVMISILIEDQSIYELQKTFFELLWKSV